MPILIGTDVLSRGIDVEGIDLVVNFDAPHDAEDYVHRIGRTARAATTGTAITLVNAKDKRKLENIEKLIDKKIERMPLPEHFAQAPAEPANPKPTSERTGRSNKPKKKFWNKKPKSGDNKPKTE